MQIEWGSFSKLVDGASLWKLGISLLRNQTTSPERTYTALRCLEFLLPLAPETDLAECVELCENIIGGKSEVRSRPRRAALSLVSRAVTICPQLEARGHHLRRAVQHCFSSSSVGSAEGEPSQYVRGAAVESLIYPCLAGDPPTFQDGDASMVYSVIQAALSRRFGAGFTVEDMAWARLLGQLAGLGFSKAFQFIRERLVCTDDPNVARVYLNALGGYLSMPGCDAERVADMVAAIQPWLRYDEASRQPQNAVVFGIAASVNQLYLWRTDPPGALTQLADTLTGSYPIDVQWFVVDSALTFLDAESSPQRFVCQPQGMTEAQRTAKLQRLQRNACTVEALRKVISPVLRDLLSVDTCAVDFMSLAAQVPSAHPALLVRMITTLAANSVDTHIFSTAKAPTGQSIIEWLVHPEDLEKAKEACPEAPLSVLKMNTRFNTSVDVISMLSGSADVVFDKVYLALCRAASVFSPRWARSLVDTGDGLCKLLPSINWTFHQAWRAAVNSHVCGFGSTTRTSTVRRVMPYRQKQQSQFYRDSRTAFG